MRRIVGLVVVLWSTAAWGQFAVLEAPGPLLEQTVWTSFQQTLNTIEAVFHSAQWVEEMTSYTDGALGGGFEDDLNALFGIVGETQLILWEARSIVADITRLYGLHDAPDASKGFRDRLQEAQFWQYERKRRVQEIQSLPGRIARTVDRIKSLWSRILSVRGSKQSGQQLQQMLQQMQHLEAQSQVVVASYQQIMLTETYEQPLIDESLRRINTNIYSTMPRPR